MLQKNILKLMFSTLFTFSLMLGLVIFLPLSIITKSIQNLNPGLSFQSTNGNWWNGSVWLSYREFKQVNMQWELDLQHLWSGQIQSRVNIEHSLLKGSTLVTVPLHNLYSKNSVELYLDGGQFTASIAQIIHYLPSTPYPLPPITGQVTLFNESLSLDIQQLDHQGHGLPMINLHSPIRFSTSNILVSNSLNIGVFNGKITSTSTPLSYQLFLTNPSTPLMMTGYSVLTAHELSSNYQVNPSDNVASELITLLDLLGKKLQNGGYGFNTRYPI